jgi:hypothetical protein
MCIEKKIAGRSRDKEPKYKLTLGTKQRRQKDSKKKVQQRYGVKARDQEMKQKWDIFA